MLLVLVPKPANLEKTMEVSNSSLSRLLVPFLGVTLSILAGSSLHTLQAQTIPLGSMDQMKLVNVKAETITFKGRKALQVRDAAPAGTGDEGRFVILSKSDFQDGIIEVDLAGEPGPNAGEGARGFVGIAFRVAADASRFECFYLRPTNGRADDQLRRNHSAQYISYPGFPWHMLRKVFT